MSKPDPRSSATLREIEFQLKPFMQAEAVEILARVMARIVHAAPEDGTQLTDQFKRTFAREHDFLSHHTQGVS